mgnify:CR=1 FL=1
MTLDHPCHNHPDAEAVVYCAKYNRYLCVDCIACYQPEQHCKHRQMCLIWEYVKHGIPEDLLGPDSGKSSDEQ